MELKLSHNKLRVVPDLDLPFLERLNISHNLLEQLPARLQLPSLVELNLSDNKFVALPPLDPNQQPKLKSLNLCNNDLYDIFADAIRLCRSLEFLEIKGNIRLRLPPSNIIERGGNAVCQYFMDLLRGRRTCWSQTVLIVGKEASGKTAICQALLGHKCPDIPQTTGMSTVGIDTVHWPTVVALPQPHRSVRGNRYPGVSAGLYAQPLE